MAKVVKHGTRVLCGGCGKHMFDLSFSNPTQRHTTFKGYAKGKYNYCAKCGEVTEMDALIIKAKEVGIL